MKQISKKVSDVLGASALGLSIVIAILFIPTVAVNNIILLSLDTLFVILLTMFIVNKFMAKAWHNKHISTKRGIAVLGFLLTSTALLIPTIQHSQNVQSQAYLVPGSAACTSHGGICLTQAGYNTLKTKFVLTQMTGKNDKCVTVRGVKQTCYKKGAAITPQTRCQNGGGVLIAPQDLIHINGSTVLFMSGNSICYKPTKAGCNIVYGGNSTAVGCACADVYGTTLGLVNVKSGCGSGLKCNATIQSGSNYIGTCQYLSGTSKTSGLSAKTRREYGTSAACARKGGTCQYTDKSCSGGSGHYLTGLCPGPNNYKCCVK